jgi:hypothetical protein
MAMMGTPRPSRARIARCRQAVHLRHLHVHQDEVVAARALHPDGLRTVADHLHRQAHGGDQFDGDFPLIGLSSASSTRWPACRRRN